MTFKPIGRPGFTKTEALLLMAVCVVAAMIVPAYLRPARRVGSRLTCSVNLKVLASDANMFARAHNGYPWRLSTNHGGTLEFSHAGDQTFRHFQVLSSELCTTRFLVCPQDTRQAAACWEELNNTNISYFVGLNSDPMLATSILAGDRNITPVSSVIVETGLSTPPRWIRSVGLHGDKGHLVFSDGHVIEVDSAGLSNAVWRSGIAANRFAIP